MTYEEVPADLEGRGWRSTGASQSTRGPAAEYDDDVMEKYIEDPGSITQAEDPESGHPQGLTIAMDRRTDAAAAPRSRTRVCSPCSTTLRGVPALCLRDTRRHHRCEPRLPARRRARQPLESRSLLLRPRVQDSHRPRIVGRLAILSASTRASSVAGAVRVQPPFGQEGAYQPYLPDALQQAESA